MPKKNIIISKNEKFLLTNDIFYGIVAEKGGIVYMKARSVTVSMIFVIVFALVLGVLMVITPRLVQWYSSFRGLSGVVSKCIVAAFYFCSVPAGVALYCLWRLLRNIGQGQIFIKDNSHLLTVISWSCIEVSLLCFAACYHYLPFGLVAVAMLFIFLIVRVVCSCMMLGTELKDENSLTI